MTIQIPVLDDRSFSQLTQEALARIPVHTPEWTNLNESDPGVTLLELFAFLTDNLLYRSNRIPEASRLKFLSMLGIALQPPAPGLGLVTVSNDKGPLAPPPPMPAGTEVSAGRVPFVTTNPLWVLPVTAAVYYKQPQALDDATLAQYRLLYQTFLTSDTEVLTFYKPVKLDTPAAGAPDPVVDLGDAVNGTIDRSLWVALLGQENAARADVRRAIAGQTLSIGVYPAAQVPGQVLPPLHTGTGNVDPGLVVEIAAPEPDPADPHDTAGLGLGVGDPRYTRLPVTWAESVLEAPGLIQVTLPAYEQLLIWDFGPEEEGTGDYPPRVDDAAVSSRIVTWLRLRYPPLPDPDPSSVAAGTAPDPSTDPSGADAGDQQLPADLSVAGCQCSCDESAISAVSTVTATATGRITWVGVNAAHVVQAVDVTHEQLGLASGTPFFSCTLANTPVLSADLPGIGASTGLVVEVQDIDGSWQAWHEIDDIYAAAPDEQAYAVDLATGVITFGGGMTGGLRPPRGAAIRASYRYGGGVQGKVAIGGINRSVALPGGYTVTNPLPTWGATDGETVADGEAAITRWLRHRDRLVTADDFSDLTHRTPGVDLGRVETLPLFNPDASGPQRDWPGMVTVMVIPRSDPVHPLAPQPDRQFLDAVCAWLAPRRLITTELHVRGPVYVPVWVSVGIVTMPGQVPSIVNQSVTQALNTFLSPLTGGLPIQPGSDGLLADPTAAGTGWPLGVNLRVQDIEAMATRVAGVRYVDSVLMATRDAAGALVSPVDTVTLTGLQLPAVTVFVGAPPAADPASLIAGSQAVSTSTVPVPVVPDVC